MWDEMDIHHVDRNRKNDKNIDVCLYYDKRTPKKDEYWEVKVLPILFIEILKNINYDRMHRRMPIKVGFGVQSSNEKGNQNHL